MKRDETNGPQSMYKRNFPILFLFSIASLSPIAQNMLFDNLSSVTMASFPELGKLNFFKSQVKLSQVTKSNLTWIAHLCL
jgi:hypothetical protein